MVIFQSQDYQELDQVPLFRLLEIQFALEGYYRGWLSLLHYPFLFVIFLSLVFSTPFVLFFTLF